MARLLQLSLFVYIFAGFCTPAIAQKFGFSQVLRDAPDRPTTFCVPANEQNIKLLANEGVVIKYAAENWMFITATPLWIDDHMRQGQLTDFYFEFAPPALLSDTARMHHFVNEVHAGSGGLGSAFTGKDVIIGYVDSGLDFNHPDFIDAGGNNRVLRYWDQTMPDNASSPQPYGYGFAWGAAAIQNGTCTSTDNNAHGTTVTGQGSGNGLANGSNKGMAPDSKIIIVESDFTRPNWTLTVADACDYIFRVADTLGLPAVVNLSLGSYFGSHDGNDPASVAMEALLDAKSGRIIVSAAGNSGAQGRHHQQGNPTADTNYVWFVNNPFANAALGPNHVFFDLWSDVGDDTWSFAMGVNEQPPSYSDRGRSNFHLATESVGVTIYDTVWSYSGNRLLTYEAYTEYIDGGFHLQMVATIDSVNKRYRFETTGSGKYDLWSGEWAGFNNQYWYAPPSGTYPDSIYYVGPDTLQSIVSSWNCSEKVISVGNMRNRLGHIDNNNNQYYPGDMTPPGKLSPNSSKGPNRHDLVKPNVVAAGDVSLSAGPLWFLANSANNYAIDSGGYHIRNGGTSLASPVVAGIAALYLERCPRATYQDFMDNLQNTAYSNAYTGTLPNNAYGYGVSHALDAMLLQNFGAVPTISSDWNSTLTSSGASGYQWYLDGNPLAGETNQDLIVSPPYGTYQVETYSVDGCPTISDPFVVTASLKDLSADDIFLYPNPAKDELTIAYDYAIQDVILVNMTGEEISLSVISGKKYSLEGIASGSYLIHVVTEEGTYTSKIVRL